MSEWDGRDRRKVERSGKPPCPRCGSDASKVIDTGMPTSNALEYRRRRLCERCDYRWTTLEINIDTQHMAYHRHG